MRYDETQSPEFLSSRQWDEAESRFLLMERKPNQEGELEFTINSLSGGERNRLFFQTDENFEEVSTVSGVDFREDGRGFVLFDFDQDGWLDLGINSAQSPRFRILRNRIGDQGPDNQAAFVNLVGGHRETNQQATWSPRDPIGAQLIVTTGRTRRAYQLSCGEGLSSQNSRWIHIGMGSAKKIDSIEVLWPSGRKTTFPDVESGARVTIFENPDDQPDEQTDGQPDEQPERNAKN